MEKVLFTVFTPTYNRGYIIEQLYHSLMNQKIFDFEWVIVDDGSSDNTREVISTFSQEKFKINYVYQENSGKHIAVNKGLDIARGEYFFIVDSDDYLLPNAIELAEKKIKEFNISDLKDFAGISFNRGFSKNRLMGKTFSGDYIDATNLERDKYNILGDKSEIYKTNILKENKFPQFENEKFISEMVVWNRIASQGYKIRWFNEIIYIGDYLEDGLTKNSLKHFANNPNGYKLMVHEHIKYGKLNLLKRMKYYWHYYKVFSSVKKISINEIAEEFHVPLFQVIFSILMGKIKQVLRK